MSQLSEEYYKNALAEMPTLRDRFAIAAIQSSVSGDYKSLQHMAEDAYRVADAMLMARENSNDRQT